MHHYVFFLWSDKICISVIEKQDAELAFSKNENKGQVVFCLHVINILVNVMIQVGFLSILVRSQINSYMLLRHRLFILFKIFYI